MLRARSIFASIAVTLACCLIACGKPEPKSDPKPPPKKAEETVFTPMLDTRNRARATEQTMQESARKVDEEVNKQTQGAP
jgi:hypothetical protein